VRRPRRLDRIHGFGIDKDAAAAGDNPDVLRLENRDTDLAPPPEAVEATGTPRVGTTPTATCRSPVGSTVMSGAERCDGAA
jgi:hypothetical protein